MFTDIPKAVLDRMSKAEVRIIINGRTSALSSFDAWNENRPEPDPSSARPWQDAPPPKSPDDYGKMRAR